MNSVVDLSPSTGSKRKGSSPRHATGRLDLLPAVPRHTRRRAGACGDEDHARSSVGGRGTQAAVEKRVRLKTQDGSFPWAANCATPSRPGQAPSGRAARRARRDASWVSEPAIHPPAAPDTDRPVLWTAGGARVRDPAPAPTGRYRQTIRSRRRGTPRPGGLRHNRDTAGHRSVAWRQRHASGAPRPGASRCGQMPDQVRRRESWTRRESSDMLSRNIWRANLRPSSSGGHPSS
jgi:hypothetical protein